MMTNNLKPFPNPQVRVDGKSFTVNMSFTFEKWIDPFNARKAVEQYIAENGIPPECFANTTRYAREAGEE